MYRFANKKRMNVGRILWVGPKVEDVDTDRMRWTS